MQRGGLLLVLACAAAAGCLSIKKRPSVSSIVRSLAPPQATEGLIVESVLVEQPVGDPFLDRELWRNAFPVGAPETRALIDENGLRLGILSGTLHQKFQTLLDSDVDTVNPQQMTFHLRKEAVLPTANPGAVCRFAVRLDLAGKPSPVELKQARCGVLVRPELAPDGRRVRLWVEPQIQHGEQQNWIRPNEDATRFTRQEGVPLERYPALGCEVTLGPDDYLLVGWDADYLGTLGSVMFAADAGGRPRQRVLVIRARFAGSLPGSDLPPITGPIKRPAVASQAAAKK